MINKKAIIFGETSLAISCTEILLKQNWQIEGFITRDSNVINWCREKSILSLSIAEVYTLPQRCYIFSVINPYIISAKLLNHLNPIKAINYHDSLLPKYAGVNSTTWGILNYEKFHGISYHEIITGIDEGNTYYQTKIAIDENETAFSLNLKCTEAALSGFAKVIENIEQNKLIGKVQDLSRKTYFGRNHIPDNYAILNPNDDLSYISNLLNSLNFGTDYSNPVATVKIILGGRCYILEKEPSQDYSIQINSNNYVIQNLYGNDKRNLKFDLTQIEDCILNNEEIEAIKRLKQQEFNIQNNLNKKNNLLEVQSGLLYSALTSKTKKKLAINPNLSVETLCLILSIILVRLNSNNTFIKIYHKNSDFSKVSNLLSSITEQISILEINSKDLNLSYLEMMDNITTVINKDRFNIIKDFGYRYNINLCSEFAITDNYFGIIDEHAIVFAINQEMVTVDFYEKDSYYVEMLIKTIDLLFMEHALAKDNNTPIKDILLLSKEEYKKIVYEWNKTEKEYPREKTIHQLFEEQVARTPNNVAIIYEDVKLTYQELNEKSNQLAHYLRKTYKIKGDDLISLLLDRSEYMIISILAVLKSGAGYVPMDPGYPEERIAYILEDTAAKVVLSNEIYKTKLQNIAIKYNNETIINNKAINNQSAVIIKKEIVDKELLPNKGLLLNAEDLAIVEASTDGVNKDDIVYIDSEKELELNRINQAVGMGNKNVGDNSQYNYDVCLIDHAKFVVKLEKESTDNLSINIKSNNLAYVIYTSGTTGKPKGVMIEHRSVVNFVSFKKQYIESNDIFASYINYTFDAINTELYPSLLNGNKLYLINNETRNDLNKMYYYILEKKITILALPAIIASEFSNYNLTETFLRILILGGDVFYGKKYNSIQYLNQYGVMLKSGQMDRELGKM